MQPDKGAIMGTLYYFCRLLVPIALVMFTSTSRGMWAYSLDPCTTSWLNAEANNQVYSRNRFWN